MASHIYGTIQISRATVEGPEEDFVEALNTELQALQRGVLEYRHFMNLNPEMWDLSKEEIEERFHQWYSKILEN